MVRNIETLLKNWQKRNILGEYFSGRFEAKNKILGLIPVSSSVGFSGSLSLGELGIIKDLESRGNKVFNPYLPGLSREDSLELRRLGANSADYYLASPNAISQSGELVFLSGFGNRTSGVSYAKNTILLAGINKVSPSLEEALKRAREYAGPLNCKRLNWPSACFTDGLCRQEACYSPEYKRMCCQTLVIEAEVVAGRLKIFLVGENLGY